MANERFENRSDTQSQRRSRKGPPTRSRCRRFSGTIRTAHPRTRRRRTPPYGANALSVRRRTNGLAGHRDYQSASAWAVASPSTTNRTEESSVSHEPAPSHSLRSGGAPRNGAEARGRGKGSTAVNGEIADNSGGSCHDPRMQVGGPTYVDDLRAQVFHYGAAVSGRAVSCTSAGNRRLQPRQRSTGCVSEYVFTVRTRFRTFSDTRACAHHSS